MLDFRAFALNISYTGNCCFPGPLELLGSSGNLQDGRVGVQKRRTGNDAHGCPRLLAFNDSRRENEEVCLAATLPTQSDGKGEWESGLTCLPVEGTLCVILGI